MRGPRQNDPNSAYLSLLDQDHDDHDHDHELEIVGPDLVQQRRPARPPQDGRSWFAAVETRQSWTGERQPTRKLVKEQHSGSGRPSFSLELSDSEVNKDKGLMRRQIARLRELYRRADKSRSP